jgi:hypothetical protein
MKFHLFHKEPLSNIIGYNDIVKRAVDFALLFFFLVFHYLKWGLMCSGPKSKECSLKQRMDPSFRNHSVDH